MLVFCFSLSISCPAFTHMPARDVMHPRLVLFSTCKKPFMLVQGSPLAVTSR